MTYIINSDPGHARSKQQMDKNLERFFASSSKSTDEKDKVQSVLRYTKTKQEIGDDLSVFVCKSVTIKSK